MWDILSPLLHKALHYHKTKQSLKTADIKKTKKDEKRVADMTVSCLIFHYTFSGLKLFFSNNVYYFSRGFAKFIFNANFKIAVLPPYNLCGHKVTAEYLNGVSKCCSP